MGNSGHQCCPLLLTKRHEGIVNTMVLTIPLSLLAKTMGKSWHRMSISPIVLARRHEGIVKTMGNIVLARRPSLDSGYYAQCCPSSPPTCTQNYSTFWICLELFIYIYIYTFTTWDFFGMFGCCMLSWGRHFAYKVVFAVATDYPPHCHHFCWSRGSQGGWAEDMKLVYICHNRLIQVITMNLRLGRRPLGRPPKIDTQNWRLQLWAL